jgi:hypothetical protein
MLAAKQVAEHHADRLRALPAWAAKVHLNHPHAFGLAELPAWRVEYLDEPLPATLSGNLHEHRLRMVFHGVARDIDDLDSVQAGMTADALSALFGSRQYGTEPGGDITSTKAQEGEAAVGIVSVPVTALYFTDPTDPETILS